MADQNVVPNEKEMTPQEYFDNVSSRRQQMTNEGLDKLHDNCMELINKYRITGQVNAMKKLIFQLDCIETEREIVNMGIDTFVYEDDIDFYIEHVSDKVVKIIELERYEREIPDAVVKQIELLKTKFNQFYIVFTDYTGRAERQVERERQAKDPILFGVFFDKGARTVNARFYYIADWEDEYCDLTLEKMVNETKRTYNRDIEMKIKTPKDIDELRNQLNALVPKNDSFVVTHKKPNVITRIKLAIWGKKH